MCSESTGRRKSRCLNCFFSTNFRKVNFNKMSRYCSGCGLQPVCFWFTCIFLKTEFKKNFCSEKKRQENLLWTKARHGHTNSYTLAFASVQNSDMKGDFYLNAIYSKVGDTSNAFLS